LRRAIGAEPLSEVCLPCLARKRRPIRAGVAGRNEVVTKLSSEIVKEDAIALADALRI
jgi:hypothetical protein